MDTLIQLVGWLSGIAVIASGVAGALGHKNWCIWTGYAAFCFAGLAAACILQDREWKQLTSAHPPKADSPPHTANRPWVGVVVARLVEPIAEGKKPKVQLTLHNSGTTPAINTQIVSRVAIGSELPQADNTDQPPAAEPSSLVLIADGNADGICEATWTMTPERLRAVRDGAIAIYAVGTVTYFDVAKISYVTRFCFFIKGDALDNGMLSAYRSGNEIE